LAIVGVEGKGSTEGVFVERVDGKTGAVVFAPDIFGERGTSA